MAIRVAVAITLLVCSAAVGAQASDFHCGKAFMSFATTQGRSRTSDGAVAIPKERVVGVRRHKDGSVVIQMQRLEGEDRRGWRVLDPSDWSNIIRCLD